MVIEDADITGCKEDNSTNFFTVDVLPTALYFIQQNLLTSSHSGHDVTEGMLEYSEFFRCVEYLMFFSSLLKLILKKVDAKELPVFIV